MKLILLGAPGAGKGTQADNISEKLGIPVIGTGNIIREEMKQGTPAGQKAKGFVESGGLVPDELVIEMLKSRIAQDDCKNGFILDGFPRNAAQAKALDAMGIVIDRVIEIYVPDEKITRRMGGRRVCRDCGSSYHMEYKQPKAEGICDKCAAQLIIRADDKPETVQERLRVYHEQTAPLKKYYEERGKLFIVEGQEELADTTRLTFEALEAPAP
ncbi:MAG: adenylate kinase [Oscillospiraceae bacterium]|nr:adenylate kinase [Oscillospiraceae bacterium]